MKQYFIYLIASFAFLFQWANDCSAQEYVPFPTDSSYQWVEYIAAQPCDEEPVYKLYAQFRLNGDTIINLGNDSVPNNKTFKKLETKVYNEEGSNPWYYYGALREEDKRVYFYPLDNFDTTYHFDNNFGYGLLFASKSYLLYDFNKGIGDTVYNYFEGDTISQNSSLRSYIINNIDSILIGNEYRKIYYTNNLKIVEGIGDLENGLLSNFNLIPTCGDYHFTQSCFHNDTATLYLNPQFVDCYNLPLSSVSNIPNDAHFSIYPNPVNNGSALNIFNRNQEMYQVKIVDLLGRTILVNTLKPGNNVLNLNQAASTQLLQVLIYDKNNRLVNSNKVIVK